MVGYQKNIYFLLVSLLLMAIQPLQSVDIVDLDKQSSSARYIALKKVQVVLKEHLCQNTLSLAWAYLGYTSSDTQSDKIQLGNAHFVQCELQRGQTDFCFLYFRQIKKSSLPFLMNKYLCKRSLNFSYSDFDGFSFSGTELQNITWLGAHLKGVTFHPTIILKNINFRGAHLRGAYLFSILKGACFFQGSDVTEACLEPSNSDSYKQLLSDTQQQTLGVIKQWGNT